MEHICPNCHTAVRESDYFCFNCGKNLHPVPLRTDKFTEFMYYGASILFPPLGFWWGIKYLRQNDPASKRIAYISMGLTVITTILATVWSVQLVNGISTQINQQLETIQGF